MKLVLANIISFAVAAFASAPPRADVEPQIAALSARLAPLSERLQRLAERLARSQAAVPTAEEFRLQVTDGRKKLEAMRAQVNDAWKEVKRLAEARGEKLDARLVKSMVPESLAADAEYQAARAKAMEAAERFEVLEKRLIAVMLTTAFENPAPLAQTPPDETALAREWQNLATHQKAFREAVLNARAKATAAKLDFKFSTLLDPTAAPAPNANRPFAEASEKAAIRRETRDATAELVASLEFLKAVGPRYENW